MITAERREELRALAKSEAKRVEEAYLSGIRPEIVAYWELTPDEHMEFLLFYSKFFNQAVKPVQPFIETNMKL